MDDDDDTRRGGELTANPFQQRQIEIIDSLENQDEGSLGLNQKNRNLIAEKE